jgi:hypothetical protein
MTDALAIVDALLATVKEQARLLEALRGQLAEKQKGSDHLLFSNGVEAKAAEFRAICREKNLPLTDDYVGERGACVLVRKALSTMRNRRYADAPIPFRKVGRRVEYALRDLAIYVLSEAESPM